MNVYLDTNVVLDLLLARKPFDTDAEQIFRLIIEKQIIAHLSALSYGQIGYFLEKGLSKPNARNRLRDLQEITETIAVDDKIITNAIASDLTDFEDAIQFACAMKVKSLHALITRNQKHFKNKELLVLSPKEFLNDFNN
jgi:predicted nucleic acid-binding protein